MAGWVRRHQSSRPDEARIMFVSLGADDWIARVKARGHAMLEEK
ncbi:MAG TPA: hypothetical protein VF394_11380 [Candidatus Acidoferrum sp.]